MSRMSDLDNRCALPCLQLYEREGDEQHEYSLRRQRFTDCSVEATLRSDRLGCLSWPGRRGFCTIHIAHMRDIKKSAGSRQIDR